MEEARKYLEEELASIDRRISETRALEADPQMAGEVLEEIGKLQKQKEDLVKALTSLDSGGSPEESATSTEGYRVAIIEVRGAVGGDEAKIWADDLLRMYTRFANMQGYKVGQLDEGVVRISGKGSFDIFKYETGVHRVQRVPETEAQGRIHTSTASVVVLPEVPETEISIRPDELEWEFSRAGGHGGQNVNKVATAVRLRHKPSGIVVSCRMERSQEQNRQIALQLLRAQLWEIEQEKKQQLIAGQRAQIGRSTRAEKIRTYNYPQNRVTDHRIGKSWHKLDRIMEGELKDVLETLSSSLKESESAV